jgi:hypothetical protein
VLENVPAVEKDWHPGSNGQILDLVHPSLYCIVYGRTHAYLRDKPRVPANLLPVAVPTFVDLDDWIISKVFCWLPSDFSVGTDGSVKLVSPYINNLDPAKHQPLYRIIEEILSGFIPMFDRVLGDIDNQNPVHESSRVSADCIWGDDGPEGQDYEEYEEYLEGLGDDEEILGEEEYYNSKKEFPEGGTYNDELEKTLSLITLRGRTIQCIIKLANIHLTPERPEYPGGSWHVEGTEVEHAPSFRT